MGQQQYPEPTVGALIFDAQDRLFLMRSHKWKGKYVIPGGHIELGEPMVEALELPVERYTTIAIAEYRKMKSL